MIMMTTITIMKKLRTMTTIGNIRMITKIIARKTVIMYMITKTRVGTIRILIMTMTTKTKQG